MPLFDNKLTIFAVQMKAWGRILAFRPKPINMRHRSFVYLLTMIFLTSVFSSCWDNFEEMTYSSANLKRFYFKQQNACVGIQYYVFYIDQKNGLVYNGDSLPYGRVVDHLIPTMEFYSSNGLVYLNDTLTSVRDTLDFTSPVWLKNTSADGQYTRTYAINIKVHQVDPTKLLVSDLKTNLPADSSRNRAFRMSDGSIRWYYPLANGGFSVYQMDTTFWAWSKVPTLGLVNTMNVASIQQYKNNWYATDNLGGLYVSGDGFSWSAQPAGIKLLTLFGSMSSNDLFDVNDSYLIGLSMDNTGAIHSARSADGVTWEVGAELNADFPVNDYASVTWKSATDCQYVSVMTGLRADGAYSSSAWATEDGLKWINIAQGQKLPIANKRGAMLFYYEDKLVCYGGIGSSGTYATKLYVSKDHGKTWIGAPSNWVIPALETGDAYGSVLVDRIEDAVNNKDRFFVWRIGGMSGSQTNHSMWKTYEYQALFARR